ncbi:putative F-box domain-containing protein [Seiridium unicorne]|uniref:F-box domain-containing protein n=1 Tax=Seiridium unicorne TaxID=138068 RepID=A0ABR2UVH7_9PEZI
MEHGDLAAAVKYVTFNPYHVSWYAVACWTHPWMPIAFVADKLPNLKQYSLHFCGSLDHSSAHFNTVRRIHPLPAGNSPFEDGSEYFFNLLGRINSEIVFVSHYPAQPTSFLVNNSCLIPNTDQDPQFDPSKAGEALNVNQHTLEALHLDLRHGKFWPNFPVPISSLEGFVALKTLFIDSTVVCSRQAEPSANPQRLTQMLPPDLESLELIDYPGDGLPLFASMFLNLVEAMRKGQFQTLKRVRCDARFVLEHQLRTFFDDHTVAEEFSRVGVVFTYNVPPLGQTPPELRGWVAGLDHYCGAIDEDRGWERLWNYVPLLFPGEHDDNDL